MKFFCSAPCPGLPVMTKHISSSRGLSAKRRAEGTLRFVTFLFGLCLLLAGCSRHSATQLAPKAYGIQIVEVSGGKQTAAVGSALPQPVVVQVNDAGGNPVTGALVRFRGEGMQFDPAEALSDSSGQ